MTETFLALEDTQGRCSVCGAMKSKATHPSYWRYWEGDGSCQGKNHKWIKED